MNRKHFLWIGFVLLLATSLMTACTPSSATAVSAESAADTHDDDDGHEEADTHDDNDEHEEGGGGMDGMAHAHVEAPDEFTSLTNPFADDHEAVEAGEALFQTNCVACHGETGMGDGPAAENLEPKPATLADGEMMGTLSDGYLYWRVSKGGMTEPFNSAMPAWEAAFTEDQRWQIVSYVRSLSGAAEHMEDEHVEDEHMEDEHMEDDHSD